MNSKKKILVVDDDKVTHDLLGHILNAQGFNVLTAYTGKKAIKIANCEYPDLILLDLVLPQLDGFAVCEALQKNSSTKNIPIIMMTSSFERDNVLKGLALGAIDLIKKPFDRTEIIARVKSNVRFREVQRSLEKKQQDIERDMETARIFQRSLLPNKLPKTKTWRFAGRYLPSGLVGGDLYDVIDLGNGELGVLIADVSGHGVQAALFVSMLKGLMTTHARDIKSPGNTVRTLNNLLVDILPEDIFIALFYGVISDRDRVINYTVSGFPKPILISSNGEVTKPLDITNFVVGAYRDEEYSEGIVELKSGEKVIIYTDGLTDVSNANGEQFSNRMLRDVICRYRNKSIEELNRLVFNELDNFRQGEKFEDDIAVLWMEAL